MKERPILFSAPMILALLEGRKTQTRRIVKGTEKFPNIINFNRAIVDDEPQYRDSGMPVWYSTEKDGTTREWGCKFGEVGDAYTAAKLGVKRYQKLTPATPTKLIINIGVAIPYLKIVISLGSLQFICQKRLVDFG